PPHQHTFPKRRSSDLCSFRFPEEENGQTAGQSRIVGAACRAAPELLNRPSLATHWSRPAGGTYCGENFPTGIAVTLLRAGGSIGDRKSTRLNSSHQII